LENWKKSIIRTIDKLEFAARNLCGIATSKKGKKRLRYIRPNLFVSENIALVGSSGRLKRNAQGKSIDSFDEVIRFNRAAVNGFEELSGSKTTINALNSHVFQNIPTKDLPWFKGWEQSNTSYTRDLRGRKIICYDCGGVFETRRNNIHKSNRCWQLRARELYKLKREIGFVPDADFSIGVALVVLCVVSGIKPHLFGFDIEEGAVRDHYWDNIPPDIATHAINAEMKLLRKLSEQELIVVHV